jgi:hypothetical protein
LVEGFLGDLFISNGVIITINNFLNNILWTLKTFKT